MFKSILKKVEEFRKKINKEIYFETKYYQKIYNFQLGEKGEHDTWNNEADAFKHTFGSAWLSLKYNNFSSSFFGYYHEVEGNLSMGQPKEEEIMDTHNNKEGRKIAEEIKKYYPNWKQMPERKIKDIIAKNVMQKMNNGLLIKSPKDVKTNEKEAMVQKFFKMYSDYQRQNMKEYIENILFNNFSKNQQNLKSQSGKSQNMNFAELIRQPQVLAPQNGQFNSPQVALKDSSIKYNYSKNKTANNKMQFQKETPATLAKGSALKPQSLPQSGGESVLNTINNSSIKDVQYNNLPEFKPMNIQLENVPVYNFGTTNYLKIGKGSSETGMFDKNEILKLSMDLLSRFLSN